MLDALVSDPICLDVSSDALAVGVKEELLAALPKLRSYAISLCGRAERADDLVQETVVRAWAHVNSFTPGSNMKAWLFTILRNLFYSEHRKSRYEIADEDGFYASRVTCPAVQEAHMDFLDFRNALDLLEPAHREALILVGASGFSYEHAATLSGCAVGTMKSRVNRARQRLSTLFEAPGAL